ncbi:single-stranded DNA-binding protein [Euzebya tangerina]|uniref:single-stranded DNA-binding protein n=1 Tax=Euzebya tangerina TaxID=591198 RepID=UPI000E3124E4|nr:single-stranded DNA-binding protein [Euzebya tangerina]
MTTPNTITVAGNLTADPDYRVTSGEIPLVRIRMAVSRRTYNKANDSWDDRHDGFFTVVCWREMARHASASLRKGDRVVVSGRLIHREYEVTPDGDDGPPQTRSVVEIEADEIGGSLRWSSWARMQTRAIDGTDHETASTGQAAEDTAVAPAA